MLFPNLSNFEKGIESLMMQRAGNNQDVSGMTAWVRLISPSGLVLESLPAYTTSFRARYGTGDKSGQVGTDLFGRSVYADGPDRGFRPSPTIESLSITFGAGGLNRKCTFDIVAYSLPQAEKIAPYFLEPGFTVVVEFGWNTDKSINQRIDASNYCQMTRFLNYTKLKERQENSGFEYDGFLGYITGGGMKSAEGEKYIISVELTTIGEIPMYLQQHRGGNTTDAKKNEGGEKYTQASIEGLTTDFFASKNVGKALFYQMFNRLPEQKQTAQVKLLLENANLKPAASDEGNFINMDDEVKKTLIDELQDTDVESATDDSSAEIPEGAPLVSEASYIRVGLAFEILNAYALNLEAKSNPCGDTTFSYLISYKNTICRANKYIFSMDGSKLMIPNPNTPDFGLIDVLTSKEEIKISKILTEAGVPTKTINLNQFKDNTHAFPQQVSLSESRYNFCAGSIKYDLPAGTYGFLEDLYINFEFFCEVLGRANYVTKDIYYELLNGLSVGANSIWHFDIAQLPDKDGMYQLEVIDKNICGITPSIFENATKFQSSGVKTPFLSSQLSMDIPAAMKNMIVGKRSDSNPDTASEGNLPFEGIFAKNQDPVLKLLDSFQPKEQQKPNDPDAEKGKSEKEDEARKRNYEMFMSKATVVPTIKDRDADDMDAAEGAWYNIFNNADANIEDIVAVVAWSDPELFRVLDLNDTEAKKANNVLVPITFDFEIFGISGIKTGDLFRILDLPKQYTESVFQVTEVSHSLSSNLWKTNVKGMMRNIS